MSTLFSHFFAKNNEIRPQEADFTEVLASIAVTPKMLYFYGKMPENRLKPGCKRATERPKTIAIVGSRKPSKYGESIAYKLAYEAAKAGAVVVSGLAFGIDAVAHRGALDAGGVTVAVLGTAIDQIYPAAHQGLAEEIIEKGGMIMSEVAPGVRFRWQIDAKKCFLERNRLISGLSDIVVIPEAAERSGSLNTAAHALEQGREVFAVPGDITRPLSQGCNRLIRQGATPLLGINDALDVLFPPKRKVKLAQTALSVGDSPAETAILQLLAAGIRDGEHIMAQSGLNVAEFSQTLTLLEIKNRVLALGANQWMLK